MNLLHKVEGLEKRFFPKKSLSLPDAFQAIREWANGGEEKGMAYPQDAVDMLARVMKVPPVGREEVIGHESA